MKIEMVQLSENAIRALDRRGIQASQHWVAQTIRNPQWLHVMMHAGPCAAFIDPQGVVAIGGIIEFGGTGRGAVWAIFAADSGRNFVGLYRKMRRAMLSVRLTRYEAYINPNFAQARRMACLAGFEREGLMRRHENGQDRELWALV